MFFEELLLKISKYLKLIFEQKSEKRNNKSVNLLVL